MTKPQDGHLCVRVASDFGTAHGSVEHSRVVFLGSTRMRWHSLFNFVVQHRDKPDIQHPQSNRPRVGWRIMFATFKSSTAMRSARLTSPADSLHEASYCRFFIVRGTFTTCDATLRRHDCLLAAGERALPAGSFLFGSPCNAWDFGISPLYCNSEYLNPRSTRSQTYGALSGMGTAICRDEPS